VRVEDGHLVAEATFSPAVAETLDAMSFTFSVLLGSCDSEAGEKLPRVRDVYPKTWAPRRQPVTCRGHEDA